jgi:TPR repeat protein
VKTGKPVSAFQAPASDNIAVTYFSPDGTMIAKAGRDQIIRFFNADTGKLMASLKGHSEGLNDWTVDFSPDGSRLVTGDHRGVYNIWSMESISLLSSTPVRQLIKQAEIQTRLTLRRVVLEPDTPEPNLFGTPPKPPLWPERHPFHWLDSAEKGDVTAMLRLGAIYERSGEVEKAVQWYQKAAHAGSAEGKKKLEALETRSTGR